MACEGYTDWIISGGAGNLDIYLTQITEFDWKVPSSLSEYPSPIGSTLMDRIQRQSETVNISGFASCYGCGIQLVDLGEAARAIKQARNQQLRAGDDFFTLDNEHFFMVNMALIDASTRIVNGKAQSLEVSLTFKAAEFCGEVVDPFYEIAGLVV